MASLSVVVNGSTVSLSDGDPYLWIGDDRLGMAPSHRITERGVLQHGDTDLGYRLDPRNLTLIMGIKASTLANAWTYRSNLVGYFAPYNAPSLAFTLENGAVRYLDVVYGGDLAMPNQSGVVWPFQKIALTVRAADPTFYNPTEKSASFIVGFLGETQVPSSVATPVGGSAINSLESISYGGTWLTYPIIRLTGPMTDAVVRNTTTGEKLDFTGISIASGDYYEIDLRYGFKTVTDAAGTNKIADLTSDSDLATWHLEPAGPVSATGTNVVQVTGSGGAAASQVEIRWFERFLGI